MPDFLSQINKDLAQVLGVNGTLSQNIIFTPPTGSAVTITGNIGKHALEVSENGFISVNTKKAHVTITESALLAKGYITRNGNGNLITFSGHKVTFTDQSGLTKTYIIQDGESRSDESVGTIVFILGYFNPS